MKKPLLLLAAIFTTLVAVAQQRSAEEMLSIANAIFSTMKGASYAKGIIAAPSLQLYGMSSQLTTTATTSNEAFAVYTPEDGNGFVIVSANVKMPEVLASCADNTFDIQEGKNEGLVALLNNYVVASDLIASGKATATEIFGSTKNIVTTSTSTIKEPLLGSIEFDQNNPYNKLCPAIHDTICATGCVATSMAQVMKYYRYPDTGVNNISYITKTHKIPITYKFSDTTFEWDKILNTYTGMCDPSKPVNLNTSDYRYAFDNTTFVTTQYKNIIRATRIFNMYSETTDGYLQLILYNTSGTIVRHASNYNHVSNAQGRGFSTFGFLLNLPSDIPDGQYRMSMGYTTDSINYILARQSYSTTAAVHYITIEKTGSTYTILGNKYVAGAGTPEQCNAIATLMAACGAAAQANYGESKNSNGVYETGAYSNVAWAAMNTYFKYDPDVYYVSTKYATIDKIYTDAKEELDKGHIIPVSGRSVENYGHSYLIDGYDMTGEIPKFHINWGWNGSSNAYFLLTQMQPSQAGTGGSTTNYSDSYSLYMNVSPDNKISEGNIIGATNVSVTTSNFSVTQLTNLGLVNSISDTLYVYMVSNDGTIFKTTYYTTACHKNILPPNYYKSTISWNSFNIPATVPNGTYHLEFLHDVNDKFFCASNPSITVTGNFDLKEGDVNCDGYINKKDVDAIITRICGGTLAIGARSTRPDVNGDGSIDIRDVNKVVSIICNSNK